MNSRSCKPGRKAAEGSSEPARPTWLLQRARRGPSKARPRASVLQLLRGRSRVLLVVRLLFVVRQHELTATAVAGRASRDHRLGGGAVPARAAIHAHHLVRMRVDLGPALIDRISESLAELASACPLVGLAIERGDLARTAAIDPACDDRLGLPGWEWLPNLSWREQLPCVCDAPASLPLHGE